MAPLDRPRYDGAMLSEDDYTTRAHAELLRLVDAFDRIDADGLEVELQNDILTLEFADGGKYVVNSHRAARQIWMAADRSAWHFDWDEAKNGWIALKTGDELWSTLERVTAKKLGSGFQLPRS